MSPALAMQKLHPKKTYKPQSKIEVFFTGGTVSSPSDASFIACPCSDQVKIVDLATSAVTATLPGDSEPITSLCVSPDGEHVFASSRSLQTKWWHIKSGECKRSWKACDAIVSCLATDSSGGLLGVGSAQREIRVWDVEGGFCTHSFKPGADRGGHSGIVSCVTFQYHPARPATLLMISGGEDGRVCVWDLMAKKLAVKFDNHFSAVSALVVGGSGSVLLSGGRDKVVNIYSLADNKLLTTVAVFESLEGLAALPASWLNPDSLADREHGPASKRSKSKDGLSVHFVTAGEKGILRVWRSDSGKCVYTQPMSDVSSQEELDSNKSAGGSDPDTVQGFKAVFIASLASQMVAVTWDQRVLLYDSLAVTAAIAEPAGELKPARQLIGNIDQIVDLRFVDAEEKFLAVATNSEQVWLYDLSTMACARSFIGHRDILLCLDVVRRTNGSPLLVSGGKDNTVRVWDVDSARCLGVGTGHTAAVSAVAASRRSGKFIVSGGSDRTLKVWSIDGLHGGAAPLGSTPVSLISTAVVAAHDKDINSVAVSPNDSLLCSGSQDRTAKLWKLPELGLQLTLRGHKRGIWSVEFSPVDQCVVTSSGDMTIRIWALGDGACLKTLEGHTASVLKASFLTLGTQLISSGADGLVKLWTIKSGECVGTFDQHEDKVWALAVSPNSEMVATGGSDSLVNVWVDCTALEEEEAIKEQEEEMLRDQDLTNALASSDYARAVQLAFELRRPYKMLSVFTELIKLPESDAKMKQLLSAMEAEDLKVFLQYVREWNTNSKFCHVAQRVLGAVLRSHPPHTLLEINGIREIIEGLLPYSQRHYARMDRLVRSTFLLDFTLSAMAVLTAAQGGDEDYDPVMARVLKKREDMAAMKSGEGKGKRKGEKKKTEPVLVVDGRSEGNEVGEIGVGSEPKEESMEENGGGSGEANRAEEVENGNAVEGKVASLLSDLESSLPSEAGVGNDVFVTVKESTQKKAKRKALKSKQINK